MKTKDRGRRHSQVRQKRKRRWGKSPKVNIEGGKYKIHREIWDRRRGVKK